MALWEGSGRSGAEDSRIWKTLKPIIEALLPSFVMFVLGYIFIEGVELDLKREEFTASAADKLKSFLTRGLMDILSREETARTINAILASQVEKLLVKPIGRVGDLVPEEKVRRAADMLTERIESAARERLPAAIAEFDIGRIECAKTLDRAEGM